MRIEREVEIAASPEEVYDLVMDPRRLGEWVTIHQGLKDAPAGRLERGSELTQCLRIAGQRFNVRWKVKQADRPRRVVWDGRGPVRSRARADYALAPAGAGTRFSYVNEYRAPGGPLGKLADRVVAGTAEREATKTLERLKAVLERR